MFLYVLGPLLTYKRPELRGVELYADCLIPNSDVICIRNSGSYTAVVDLGIEDGDEKNVFSLETTTCQLEPGEMKDIKMWAFPSKATSCRGKLVICVQNNPDPIQFELRCLGVVPSLEVDGPWRDNLEALTASIAACKEKKTLKELESKLAGLKECYSIEFDRILLSAVDTRTVLVRNKSALAVAWEIDFLDFKGDNLVKFSPTNGILPAGASVAISVSFESPEVISLSGRFLLRYSDDEQGLTSLPSRAQSLSFRVLAEAYTIQSVITNAEGQELPTNQVDFGCMRVGDVALQSVRLLNRGKYRIAYSLAFRKNQSSLAAVLSFDPMNGFVEPGEVGAEIRFRFCSIENEVSLQDNKDLRIRISEPTTNAIVEEFSILISAVTKYNQFRMQPSKGISFGAVRYDSGLKTKRIEICNEGFAEFTYIVLPEMPAALGSSRANELESLSKHLLSAFAFNTPFGLRKTQLGENYLSIINAVGGGKQRKESKSSVVKRKISITGQQSRSTMVDPDNLVQEPVVNEVLKVGSIVVSSRVGIVQPGQTAGFDISFDPLGMTSVREKFRIAISGVNERNLAISSSQSFYVSGEGCFPAITTDDISSIFEEQEIVPSLLASTATGEKEMERIPVGKVVFAEKERTLVFGPIMCNQTGSKGTMERIRISNPTKIDVQVSFRVEPVAGESSLPRKGGKEKKTGGQQLVSNEIFSVTPHSWDIPPHEHRFVSVHFNPLEINTYRADFFATVDTGSGPPNANARGKVGLASVKAEDFVVHLLGSSTLPTIAVDSPLTRQPDGALLLDFGKVHVGKRLFLTFSLRNAGVMPAVCLFDMTGDMSSFSFQYRGASAMIAPYSSERVSVAFCPRLSDKRGAFESTIRVSVLHNPFDHYTFKLKGTSFQCDAIIVTNLDNADDNVPSREQDSIHFAELNLADGVPSSTSHTIYIRSTCDAAVVKYSFCVSDQYKNVITFSPSTGHLAPRSMQEVVVTFSTSTPVTLSDVSIICRLHRLRYKDDEGERLNTMNWNSSIRFLRPLTDSDVVRLEAYGCALKEFEDKMSKLKKGAKILPIPPEKIPIELLSPSSMEAPSMVYEYSSEPAFDLLPNEESVEELPLLCTASADFARYTCQGNNQNIPFLPTFMFQTSLHKFTFTNDSNITLPVKWKFDEIRRRGGPRLGTAQLLSRSSSRQAAAASLSLLASLVANTTSALNPFSIEPQEVSVGPKSSQEFSIRFHPLETDEFVYALKGDTLSMGTADSIAPVAVAAVNFSEDSNDAAIASSRGVLAMVVRGSAKRPICHFEMKESFDYLARRPPNMKNELGIFAPIESEVNVAEVESIGIRSRNTYRFHVLNPTSENMEFSWEVAGDANPFWRCVYSSGMLFSGKRVEMVFEYLPEDTSVAEVFFRFRLPNANLDQFFLFSGKVIEPRVFFNSSRINFQSVMLGGEGGSEILYLENEGKKLQVYILFSGLISCFCRVHSVQF